MGTSEAWVVGMVAVIQITKLTLYLDVWNYTARRKLRLMNSHHVLYKNGNAVCKEEFFRLFYNINHHMT